MSLHPDLWFELVLAKYPASEGTTTYRWATKPLADAGAFKEGRLLSVSPIDRACTDPDGNYQVGRTTVVVDDRDGLIRSLLDSGQVTEYFANREAGVYLLSQAGRRAGLTARTLVRGWVIDVQTAGKQVTITLADVVGSQFSGFNLDKLIGLPIGDEHTDLPDASRGKIYPIYIGEHSDKGAVDVNGDLAEKGLCPVIDTGDYDITGGSPEAEPTVLDPPTIQFDGIEGDAGENTYYYAVSLITPYGESVLSEVITVANAPAVAQLSLSNYIKISGTFAHGSEGSPATNVNKVRIWGRTFNPPTTWMDEADYTDVGEWAYYDGATHPPSPTRDEIDIEKPMDPPVASAATSNDTIWGRLVVAQGEIEEVIGAPFASDLAEGTTPRRVQMDSSLDGVEYLTPDSPAWPHPTRYLDLDGIRMTVIYVRGPRLNHHRDGTVTIAVNLCGYVGENDEIIDTAGEGLQFFLNEFCLKNNGTGYRGGAFGPLETYANGDAILKTSAFAAAQAITAGWLGSPSTGYKVAIAITEPITVREFVRRFCQTFGWRLTHNHHGQIFPVIVDPDADLTAGRQLRHRIEIKRLADQTLAHDEVLNRLVYHYHWDPDAQDFRERNHEATHPGSIAAHTPGGVSGDADRRGLRSAERELFYTNDATTADHVATQELVRRRRRPRYLTPVLDLLGLELEIGSQALITHPDGLGPTGDVETPGLALRHRTIPGPYEVQVTYQDLRTIQDDGSP